MAITNRRAETLASFHRSPFTWRTKALLILAAAGLLVLVAIVPQGETARGLWGEVAYDPGTGEPRFVHDMDPVFEVGMIMGYLSGYLLLGSVLLGHKRPLGWLLRGRWRVRAHLAVGVSLMALAVGHAGVLFAAGAFETWPSGLAAVLVLGYHGVSGVHKAHLVRRWGAKRWRFQHVLTAYLGLALGLQHSLMF